MVVDKESYFAQEIPWLNKTIEEVDTDEYRTTISIPNVFADGFNLSRGFVLSKYFPEITFERTGGCLHRLEVSSTSVFRAVNLATLALMYLAATNKQPWYIDKNIAQKYIRIAKNLAPVPYFVLYLFARRCLPSQELFDSLKDELASATDLDVKMLWGNTQFQRISAVRQILIDSDTGLIPESKVVEIGCGEMDYPKAMLRHMNPGGHWISYDVEDYSKLAEIIGKRNDGKTLEFRQELETTIQEPAGGVMIAVEVIEHMPYDDAVTMLANHIIIHEPDRVIITTPNIEFNQYYAIERFRHDDHDFELTTDEFPVFISETETLLNERYSAEFFGIGDCVDGNYMSLGCLMRKK
jgi:hypothetical protein